MGSKKKDLEIIYNLQWKSKSENGGAKANIIGMYDIPATTLNWEIFKSYLLKNSGTVGDDVKVSYITDSNREFPIESQTDFQIALYAFRRKARMGDVVNLNLDRISDQTNHKNNRHSNDVETQFDTNEAVSIVSSCCNADSPPEWFITYMNKFKQKLTEEITTVVSSSLSNIKPHTVSQPSCYHSRKSKAENSKRRKLPLLTADGSHESPREIMKSLKLEGKLEHKLEKLENKTKKLKEKKLALFTKSSDSDVADSSVKVRPVIPCEHEDLLDMDAGPVDTQVMVPHMLGGEIYLHKWTVINSGKKPWTNETAVMFTWGSKALQPLDAIVWVPYLKPGETGTVAARLKIPNQPGQYECYFHFHHKSRRFGHWLGCQVIVDPFDLKGAKSVLETSHMTTDNSMRKLSTPTECMSNIIDPVTRYDDIWRGTYVANESSLYKPTHSYDLDTNTKEEVSKITDILIDPNEPIEPSVITMSTVLRDISSIIGDIKLQDPTDTNCSSDSDNQSIISLSDSNSSKGVSSEYVVVPIPDCFQLGDSANAETSESNGKLEELVKITNPEMPKEENSSEIFDDNNNEDTEKNVEKEIGKGDDNGSNSKADPDIVMVTLRDDDQEDKGFAYVMVDGQKIMIPKKMIKSEYLQNAEKSDNNIPEKQNCHSQTDQHKGIEKATKFDEFLGIESEQPNFFENDFESHCSAAGSCFSDCTAERNNSCSIRPHVCPGFEVLDKKKYTWAKSDTQYAFSAVNSKDFLVPTTISDPIPMPVPSSNPFSAETLAHVPNYQQTPPEDRKAPSEATFLADCEVGAGKESVNYPPKEPVRLIRSDADYRESIPEPSAPTPENRSARTETTPPVVHILPEALVSGAVNASPGRWENGHWVSTNPNTPREANLQALSEMGFWNRDLNATLLARYNDDLSRVVAELVQ